ncbi:GNAT family N-acetyltransferase [Tsuneonella sp. SYSU-LHT278]|uniref:GNAT family N-acetyltransferase n=1 Tax=Tsuneonella sediminis TaxID=3416089 RepID=UPI003F78D1D7
MPFPLVRAERGDGLLVGDITAEAFRDDPFNRWLLGTEAGIRGMFVPLARHVYVPRGFSYRLGDEGAAMWMLPGGDDRIGFWAMQKLRLNAIARASRGAIGRIERTVAAMEAAHPRFDHAYLFTIGVRPRAQGKGLGRTLMTPVLAACDRTGLPAYLENSNPRNHAFYRSYGFERVGMIEPQPGAPPLEAMLRRPRTR